MKKFLFLFLLAGLTSYAQICLTPGGNYSVNPYPWGICTGDFNKDGLTDFACGSDAMDGITVYLGQGNGAFGVAQTFTTGYSERGIVSADLNNDGNLDLASDNGAGGGTLSVLLGNGNGSFTSAPTFTFNASNSEDLVSGDFNEDGSMDIALTNHGGSDVSILTGDGNGGFIKDTSFSLSANSMSIVTADFNRDAHLDLGITTNYNNGTIAILFGAGTGNFGSAVHYNVGSMLGDNPWSLHTADFNGDGYWDLVCTNNTDSISVIMGTNIGTFGATKYFYSGYQPIRLAVGDMNNDNKIDLAVGNFSNISLLAGDGNGNFINDGVLAADTTMGIIATDLNSDAKMDLLYIRYVSGATGTVMLNCTPTPTCVASISDSLFSISPLNWGVVPHYSSQVTSATWYWGDGTSSTGLYPSHTYSVAGWYAICVKVYTSCGDSSVACMTDSLYRTAASSMVNISVLQNASGIAKSDMASSIQFYPNPAHDFVTLSGLHPADKIQIYSSIGSALTTLRATQGELKIDISLLPAGVYSIRVNEHTLRFIKE